MKPLPFPRSLASFGLLLLALTCPCLSPRLQGQIVLSDPGTPYEQDFDSLGIPTGGAAGTSALPANWRVDAHGSDSETAMRTLGTWSAANDRTTRNGGENLPNFNAIYNFGKPTRNGEGSGDRAIGFYGNSGGTHSGNLYAQFQNATGAALEAVQLTYDVQTFRDGTVDGGTRIALYYSLDGSNWTYAGDGFVALFSGATANTGYETTPGATLPVSGTLTLDVPVADGGLFYLAWNYSNATATSAGAAYALGVDNFSIVAVPEPSLAFLLLPAAGVWLLARRRGRRSA